MQNLGSSSARWPRISHMPLWRKNMPFQLMIWSDLPGNVSQNMWTTMQHWRGRKSWRKFQNQSRTPNCLIDMLLSSTVVITKHLSWRKVTTRILWIMTQGPLTKKQTHEKQPLLPVNDETTLTVINFGQSEDFVYHDAIADRCHVVFHSERPTTRDEAIWGPIRGYYALYADSESSYYSSTKAMLLPGPRNKLESALQSGSQFEIWTKVLRLLRFGVHGMEEGCRCRHWCHVDRCLPWKDSQGFQISFFHWAASSTRAFIDQLVSKATRSVLPFSFIMQLTGWELVDKTNWGVVFLSTQKQSLFGLLILVLSSCCIRHSFFIDRLNTTFALNVDDGDMPRKQR